MGDLVRIGNVMVERDTLLPPGETCGDCGHFERCARLFQCHPDNDRCDWSPSRFRATPARPGAGEEE